MDRSKLCFLLILALFVVPTVAQSKEYRVPVQVSYQHSGAPAQLVAGDEAETVVSFTPTQDLRSLQVNLTVAGVELVGTPPHVEFSGLTRSAPVQLKIRVRVVHPGGKVSLNYFTESASGTGGGALGICCYGTKK